MYKLIRNSIRMYFAPLIGAIKGIRAEMHRIDQEIQRDRENSTCKR